jgi:DNA-binding response OmpR family regulator
MVTSAGEGAVLAPLIVFVVEDEVLIQELIRTVMEEAGFAVLVAYSGKEALAILNGGQHEPIRGLITDVDLGKGVNGWAVAKRARELHPELPVVYVSGGHPNEWTSNGVPNSLMITKPFAPAQIVTAVSQLINAAPPPAV